jgi:hypothetical protein
MFLYDEPQADHECFECMEKSNRLDDVKYWFRAVLDQLYGMEEFNAEDLERYVEELAAYLDMKIPKHELSVVRKDRTVDMTPMLEAWKNASHNYLKSLANTGT